MPAQQTSSVNWQCGSNAGMPTDGTSIGGTAVTPDCPHVVPTGWHIAPVPPHSAPRPTHACAVSMHWVCTDVLPDATGMQ